MSTDNTIRLLIIHDSASEAQRLVSMLQNAGRPNRAQHVESAEALSKLLQEHTWDLLIAREDSSKLEPGTALRTISKLAKDVPAILLTEREGPYPVVEGLKLGARDVVIVDEDQHLLLAMQRELDALAQRRQARQDSRRYHAAVTRTRELLDSSKDAFAYISDGLVVYANESFAERFGYGDLEDVEYQPLIDMIEPQEQPAARDFLKQYAINGDEVETTEWQFTARTVNGRPLPTRAEVLTSMFDDERCIQLRIAAQSGNTEELEARLVDIKNRDQVTGLYNRNHFLQLLENAIKNTASTQQTGGLMYLEIDQFEEAVHGSVGVAEGDVVISKVAAILQSQQRSGEIAARYSDEAFCLLLPETTPDTAEHRAKELLKRVSDTIFEAGGNTLQLTASVGISLMSETSGNAQGVLNQALKAHSQALARRPEGNNAALYEPDTQVDGDADTYRRARVVQALDEGNLKLRFQPILSLQGSGENIYEALVRLVDEGEELAPLAFLETLGDAGLSSKMDRWVIMESIKAVAAEQARDKQVSLLVHLTETSMMDNGLPAWLGVAFKAAKVAPEQFVFQLRQEDVSKNLHAAKEFAEQVQALGCRIAVCRFGNGLNPFKTLEHVKVQIAKVDASFVREVQDEGEDPEALANLVAELKSGGHKVIVPHIEQASMLPTLWQTGTDYIQGYYVQAPAEDMEFDFSLD
ncbi:EAL domain-containing response regulator [Biformimicrobium ophioploci]|uniref:Cyclic di-GMP-binding protein FimX n=1 Tax=Biformimicrobium ophioploci TaxID=3036711 RepID=A0ABQ6LUQ6_9GAMM|nr:EAL domain-containing protein [Microbulbifer sp. NKW57]GMG85799.1 cyclic di-GMP-binding protein FimX [Microbulbifer sp. NKW57]